MSDKDECTEQLHDCHEDAKCSNTIGSFYCTCKSGFYGDGRKCTDKRKVLPDSRFYAHMFERYWAAGRTRVRLIRDTRIVNRTVNHWFSWDVNKLMYASCRFAELSSQSRDTAKIILLISSQLSNTSWPTVLKVVTASVENKASGVLSGEGFLEEMRKRSLPRSASLVHRRETINMQTTPVTLLVPRAAGGTGISRMRSTAQQDRPEVFAAYARAHSSKLRS